MARRHSGIEGILTLFCCWKYSLANWATGWVPMYSLKWCVVVGKEREWQTELCRFTSSWNQTAVASTASLECGELGGNTEVPFRGGGTYLRIRVCFTFKCPSLWLTRETLLLPLPCLVLQGSFSSLSDFFVIFCRDFSNSFNPLGLKKIQIIYFSYNHLGWSFLVWRFLFVVWFFFFIRNEDLSSSCLYLMLSCNPVLSKSA